MNNFNPGLSNKWEEKTFLDTYNRLQAKFPGKFDSFDAVKTVVKHRNYWKPEKVKTMLLAESHVFTTDNELAVRLKYPNENQFYDLPKEFVRLVYCLGYGEQSIVPGISKNPGTPQYWKIFAACASDSPSINYGPILKGTSSLDDERLSNKVELLKRLREKGVWLVDCNIVGLYNFGKTVDHKEVSHIIPFCWDNYISTIVMLEKPDHIIVIGYKVADLLWVRLSKTGIPFTKLPQPQAHLPAEVHQEALKTYQKICNN